MCRGGCLGMYIEDQKITCGSQFSSTLFMWSHNSGHQAWHHGTLTYYLASLDLTFSSLLISHMHMLGIQYTWLHEWMKTSKVKAYGWKKPFNTILTSAHYALLFPRSWLLMVTGNWMVPRNKVTAVLVWESPLLQRVFSFSPKRLIFF